MKSPVVEIIILNYNGDEVLPSCLKSVRENTSYDNYCVTVIDNNSGDNSIDIVKQEYDTYDTVEFKEDQGFAEANNRVIEDSDADIYLLLNNDTEVMENWLSLIVREFVANSAGIVSPKLIYSDGTPQFLGDKVLVSESHYPEFLINQWRNIERKFDSKKEIISGVGAALAIHSDVINDIGHLDESYGFYMEETDFCLRAKQAGYDITYVPDSVVIHKSRTSSAVNPYYEHYIRRKSRIRFYLLNYSFIRLLLQIPFELFAFVAALRDRDHDWFLRAYKDTLSEMSQLLKERKGRKKIHYTTNKLNLLKNWITRRI